MEQNESPNFFGANGKLVQDECQGSDTVADRELSIKNKAVSQSVDSGGSKTVQLQTNGTLSPSVAQLPICMPRSVQSTSVPLPVRSQEQGLNSDLGRRGNLVQSSPSNELRVRNVRVFNGEAYFICTYGPSGSGVRASNAAVPAAEVLFPNIAVSQDSHESVMGKCGSGSKSAVRVPHSATLDGQRANHECSQSVKAVNLEIIQENSDMLKTLPTCSPPSADSTLKQTEDDSPQPLKEISINTITGVSHTDPLVLQPVQNVSGSGPQLQLVRADASGSPENNLLEIQQQTTVSAIETSSEGLQESSVLVRNTDGQTILENPPVMPPLTGEPQLDQRREEIALQFQQDLERTRNEKEMVLPRRTVHLVEAATQTSLFSLLDPHHFVEMSVTVEASGFEDQASSESLPTQLKARTRSSIKEESQETNMDEPRASKKSLEDQTSSESGAIETNTMTRSSIKVESQETDMDQQGASEKNNAAETSPLYSNSEGIPNANVGQESNIKKPRMEQIYSDYKACVVTDDAGNIPLHHAVLDGDIHEVQRQCLLLIGRNESLDWSNRDDQTPLHLAVASGNVAVTNVLLALKSSPSERDAEGNTALHLAVGPSSNLDCLQAVLDHVEQDSDVLNAVNHDGYSALHLSVMNAKESETECLVLKGADVNLKDRKSGNTPLIHAMAQHIPALFQLLVCLGASATVANFSGQTPLSIYKTNRFPELEGGKAMDVDNPPLQCSSSQIPPVKKLPSAKPSAAKRSSAKPACSKPSRAKPPSTRPFSA